MMLQYAANVKAGSSQLRAAPAGDYRTAMPIEWEQPGEPLPPLKIQVPPVVPVEALLAVAEVHLAAGDVPPKILRQFYEGVLGLIFLEADGEALRFTHQRRRIVLTRATREPGRVAFLAKDFSDVLLRLRERNIACELLHIDAGMTRMAVLRDPAGNWVQLVETRAL